MNITIQVQKFRNFLVASWPYLDDLMDEHDWDEDVDFIDDWLQVNWKFFVGRELLSKKDLLLFWNLNQHCDHLNWDLIQQYEEQKIYTVFVETSETIDFRTQESISLAEKYRMGGFYSMQRWEGYDVNPPFDLIAIINDQTKESFLVPLDTAEFFLEEIDINDR